jgi:putative ABC transport system permease protein
MRIPLLYNLRNLTVRKTTSAMTVVGVALTVAILVADFALVSGLRRVFQSTAHPAHILVLRKGASGEVSSSLPRAAYEDLKFTAGITKTQTGDPVASLEIVTVINLPSVDSPDGMNVTLRGLGTMGIEMRKVAIREGRWFRSGQREVVVGTSIASRYPAARIGQTLSFGRGEWVVVGMMDGARSAANSEIWGELGQISSDFNRQDTPSSVLLRAENVEAVPALINTLNDDRRLGVNALSERTYYENQTVAGAPLQYLGLLVSSIMGIGSSFAAMNTMFTAVSKRTREIATLRALGFSRGSVLISFLIESVILSAIAGVFGCLIALPLNNFQTGIGNFVTFSEIAFEFQVTPLAMMGGLAFAILLGAIGGLFPARAASRLQITEALKEV